jgi:uncharacterized membrane protein
MNAACLRLTDLLTEAVGAVEAMAEDVVLAPAVSRKTEWFQWA